MDFQNIISALLAEFKEFPQKDKLDVLEFLEHGEWGVAFELICSVIEQERLSINGEQYKEIEEIGLYMEMDNDLWKVLKPVN